MTPSNDERAESVRATEAAARVFDTNIFHLRAEKLDRILNGQIFPKIGLHSALIGGCVLAIQFGPSSRLAALYGAIAGAVACLGLILRADAAHEWRLGSIGAFCAFVALAIASAPLDDMQAAYGLSLLYVAFAVAVFTGLVDSSELVFPPIYLAVLIVAVPQLHDTAPIAFGAPFLAGMLALWRRKRIQHAFGWIVGAVIILGGYLSETSTALPAITVMIVLFLGGVIIYEILSPATNVSNFRQFAMHGVAMAILLLATILLVPEDIMPRLWVWTVAAAIYLGAMSLITKHGAPVRIVWFALSAFAPIWEGATQPDVLETWWRVLANLAIALVIGGIARRIQSGFAQNVARIITLVTFFMVLMLADELPHAEDNSGVIQILRPHELVLGLMIACLAVAGVLSVNVKYPRAVPWWHGVVRPRHAVLARNVAKGLRQKVGQVPFVGGILSAIGGVFGSIRFLKSGGSPLQFGDATVVTGGVIGAFTLVACANAAISAAYLEMHEKALELPAGSIVAFASWSIFALGFYICGLVTRQTLFLFVGLIFALVPLELFYSSSSMPPLTTIGTAAFAVGLVLLSFGLMRRGR